MDVTVFCGAAAGLLELLALMADGCCEALRHTHTKVVWHQPHFESIELQEEMLVACLPSSEQRVGLLLLEPPQVQSYDLKCFHFEGVGLGFSDAHL